ncbi:hypothetical protein FE257_002550 [Aspergillus nanangensis]|uniref:Zn(2)-C6 fungal-type domain-containing protein n=1 Tax=Aspergillus nanangensis TaxID=2582783 RepID=A0AAD4CSZ8_ASPNN|nr:hypothetical protein FE257_002550 [Aspergillus nanangensis]
MDFSGVVPHGNGPGPSASQSRKRGLGRTACSRCKTRKQRCDGRLPICSSCAKSGATCDLQTVRGEDLVVAKYIQSLENRVADLEIQLLRYQQQQQQQQQQPQPSQVEPSEPSSVPGRISIGDVVNSLCLSSFADSSQFGLHLALNLGDIVSKSTTNSPNSPGSFPPEEQHQHQQRLDPSPSNSGHYPFVAAIEPRAEGAGPPSEDLGIKLIHTYSERLDWRYPFLDLEEILSLHRERDRLARVDPASLTASQRFGLFKLYLVYAIGSGLLALTEKQTSSPMPESFYTTAIQHISPTAAREPRSLENIEALVLLVIFHLRCSITQELWYLIGFAMRTCIHLGMYLARRETDLPAAVVQQRRKLFWTVYSLDRNISIALGYPTSLPDRLIDVAMPSVGGAEEDERSRQAIHIFRIRRIESRIHHAIYRNDRSLQELLPKTRAHYQQLQEWRGSLLAWLGEGGEGESGSGSGGGRRRDYFLLHYYRAIRLLIQPFLSILPCEDPYYKACLEAAGQICQLHKRLHQNADYGHSFIAVQTVFVSGIMLLYCLWTHAGAVWSIRLSNNIRACSSVLFVMGERTPWVRRYRDAFEALVSVTMERLENQQEGSSNENDISMGETAGPPPSLQDSSHMPANNEFLPTAPLDAAEETMPPPLQALQDRWMEFDTMAVVNELVTWVDPETPSAQAPWTLGYGDFGESSWEELLPF